MQDRRTVIMGALAFGALVLAPMNALAAKSAVYVNSVTGIAIGGYDPVAYFIEGRHVEGSAEFQAEWKGAPWYFASAENRDLFLSAPEDYAPQYGGYCAFAMAQGALASTAPDAWTIHKGKLYLNFSLGVRGLWREDPDGLIELADGYWPDVLN